MVRRAPTLRLLTLGPQAAPDPNRLAAAFVLTRGRKRPHTPAASGGFCFALGPQAAPGTQARLLLTLGARAAKNAPALRRFNEVRARGTTMRYRVRSRCECQALLSAALDEHH